MSISVVWHNEEKTIIRWDYGEKWTVDDFRTASAQALDLIDSVSHHVDVIAIVSNQSTPPQLLPHIRRLFDRYPENTFVITVETNQYTRMIYTTALPLLHIFAKRRIKLAMVPTIEDAENDIAEHQSNLYRITE